MNVKMMLLSAFGKEIDKFSQWTIEEELRSFGGPNFLSFFFGDSLMISWWHCFDLLRGLAL